MIYIIKQEGQGCIKTRSTPASISPITVKWAITNINCFTETKQLVYPTKFCITIVSNFSWVLQPQGKSNTMAMQWCKQGALWSCEKLNIVLDSLLLTGIC